MRKPFILAFVLAVISIASISGLWTRSINAKVQPVADSPPALINTCLITNDVERLSAFYTKVLKTEPEKTGRGYVEFRTGAGVLAIFSAEAQEKYIPGSAKPGENHSAILEFKVGDVDQEYARLQEFVQTWVKGPTNQPWGTRSIYFRDPDGNLVDFFTLLNLT
jgi:catechol 2,3-dioxygenase-like lactoylglutathione lyase family enzyme